MSSGPPCPLCLSQATQLIELLSARKLKWAYQASFRIALDLSAEAIAYLRCTTCQLRFFDPPSAGSADLYEKLQEYPWYYQEEKMEYSAAAKWVPARGRVLEVGSGKGAFARFVGPERYTGLEFNDAAILRARAAGLTLLKEPLEAHATKSRGQYTAIVAFQVLEHVPRPRSFINSCIEALEPGGRLIIAVPNHDGLCGLAQNNILDMPPHHTSHWAEPVLRGITRHFPLALTAIEDEPLSPEHRAWAQRTHIEHRLRRSLFLRESLLDTSFCGRLVSRASARLVSIVQPSVDHMAGHTILACYQKLTGQREGNVETEFIVK